MSNELVLELLSALRGDIAVLTSDLQDVKHRLSSLELGIAGLRRDLAGLYEQQAIATVRFDKLEERVQRIERRLDVVDVG